jgi:hypothetical protein
MFDNDDGFVGSVLNGLEQIDHKKLEEEVGEISHMCEEKEASSDTVEEAKSIHKITNELLKASPVEFSQLFFDAIDEKDIEDFCRERVRYPAWMAAVARAKLEGVVPLMGSGSRVMATIPHRGITIEACKGDCVFRMYARNFNDLENDRCSHPAAPSDLELPDAEEPPEQCPLRTNTFHIALDTKYFNKTEEGER